MNAGEFSSEWLPISLSSHDGCSGLWAPASLMREMRAISFVSKMIDQGIIKEGALKRMKVHGILDDETMTGLGVASKLNADWDFLTMLFEAGRNRATRWLAENFDQVGVDSTVDISGTYL